MGGALIIMAAAVMGLVVLGKLNLLRPYIAVRMGVLKDSVAL